MLMVHGAPQHGAMVWSVVSVGRSMEPVDLRVPA